MASLSRTYQDTILTAIKGNTLKLHLYSTNPTSGDTGTEISGGGYVAQTITFGANSVVGSGTECTNDTLIDFGIASGAYSAQVTHFGVRTSGGALIQYGVLSESGLPVGRTVSAGDRFYCPVGSIKLRIPD